ncbi:MAG TPA: hypothetical protein VL137_10705, partial [Polyangiaceae bacterium]|nr:hypothetical protein [Polyangiaceae bacterium]
RDLVSRGTLLLSGDSMAEFVGISIPIAGDPIREPGEMVFLGGYRFRATATGSEPTLLQAQKSGRNSATAPG